MGSPEVFARHGVILHQVETEMASFGENQSNSAAHRPKGALSMQNPSFWNTPAQQILEELQTTSQGLSSAEAAHRLAVHGANRIKSKRKSGTIALLMGQFKSPIILILIFAALLSIFLHDRTDALIILIIVLVSGLLGFWQERGADNAVAKLLSMVQVRVTARRDGKTVQVPVEEVVPGDIVELSAGSGAPGDCLILESRDLFVNEASLTGETYPVEKNSCVTAADTPLGAVFKFTPLPVEYLLFLGAIVILYIIAAEAVMVIFYHRLKAQHD
jgi:magnesium-transporting ATPase (P-type)